MASGNAPGIPARIRTRLRETPALTQSLQAGRAIVHFGPWRHAARAMIRSARRPRNEERTALATSVELDAAEIVRALHDRGVAIAGRLPMDILSRVRAVTDDLPPGEYGDFHEHPDVGALVQGADVLRVVRAYFGAEPELLECTLVVHRVEDPAETIHEQRRFHFDFAGWQSLNLFVYFTDVGDDAGAHQIVVGTHRSRRLKDAVRPWIPDDEIIARYSDRLQTIAGAAGTMFFENTEAFHRRLRMTQRRVMLNVLYASHRNWLSKGRLTPKYADYLRMRAAEASRHELAEPTSN